MKKGAIYNFWNQNDSDLFACKDNVLFSCVEKWSFRAKAHLVFHWCLYNKVCYWLGGVKHHYEAYTSLLQHWLRSVYLVFNNLPHLLLVPLLPLQTKITTKILLFLQRKSIKEKCVGETLETSYSSKVNYCSDVQTEKRLQKAVFMKQVVKGHKILVASSGTPKKEK